MYGNHRGAALGGVHPWGWPEDRPDQTRHSPRDPAAGRDADFKWRGGSGGGTIRASQVA